MATARRGSGRKTTRRASAVEHRAYRRRRQQAADAAPASDELVARADAGAAEAAQAAAQTAGEAQEQGADAAGEWGFLDGIEHPRARAFLRAYAQTGNVTEAARAAGVSRVTHYYWLQHMPGYKEAAEQAEQMAVDALEREAWRRAVEGWDEPVYQRGQLVGTVRRYSDALMTLLLRGLRPERYRERVDIGSDPQRPVLISESDAATARRLIEVMAARRGVQQASDGQPEAAGSPPGV